MAWDPVTKYKLLLEINNAIVNQTSRLDLFRTLSTEIGKLFRFDRFSINIYDPKTESLTYFSIAEGVEPEDMRMTSRPLDKGPIARAVITSRQPLVIPDMSRYSHWLTVRLMMDAGLTATMAFPLIIRRNVVGTLHLSFRSPPPNMDELADFLAELSGQVALAVDNMLVHTQLKSANTSLEQQKRYLLRHADANYQPDNFFYRSQAMREIMRQVELIAGSDESVLVTGETGTGKDYIARCIHHLSLRRDGLFVKINCPALASSLFESELFGHAKGAFTGASAKRIGRFEMAGGGTVFLDEIGDLPPSLQAKLLHVLQDKRFERVGDSRSIEADFRVISATNSDLSASLKARTFRSDLFYRLNTVAISIPPLRERSEDIPLLVERLTAIQAQSMRSIPPRYTDDAMAAFRRHTWPGNVRELKGVVTRLIIMHSGELLTKSDVAPILVPGQSEAGPAPLTLAEAERAHITKVLALAKGVVAGKSGAAALLGVPRSTLQYRLRKYNLDPRGAA